MNKQILTNKFEQTNMNKQIDNVKPVAKCIHTEMNKNSMLFVNIPGGSQVRRAV